MTSHSTIHTNVMRRVHLVHRLRTYGTPVASALVLTLSLWGIGREVWVARFFENMPSLADAGAVLRFVFSAFIHTEFVVQALTVLVLAASLWLVSDGVRNIRQTLRSA